MRKEQVKYDCSYFEGHIPCKPNKQYDVQCNNCSFYELDTTKIINLKDKNSHLKEIYKICNFQDKTLKNYTDINTKNIKVLIIKLGPLSVIRTTPLLEKFRSKYDCHFTWVHTPQVTLKNDVDLFSMEICSRIFLNNHLIWQIR